MRAGTPAIGIPYHGTKMQGIFENIGVPELVISGAVTYEKLKERIEYMIIHRDEIKPIIGAGVQRAREEMQVAIREVVREAQGGAESSDSNTCRYEGSGDKDGQF